MRRAGVEMGTLVKLVIALAVIIAISAIIAAFWTATSSSTDTCRTSVSVYLATSAKGLGMFDLYCPRKVILVGSDRATELHIDPILDIEWDRLKRGELFKKLEKANHYMYVSLERTDKGLRPRKPTISSDHLKFEDEIGRVFAYEMGECWETFRRGEVKAFKETEAWYDLTLQNSCVICSEIHIDRPGMPAFDVRMRNQLDGPHHFYQASEADNYWDFLYPQIEPSYSILLYHKLMGDSQAVRVEDGGSYAIAFIRQSNRFRGEGNGVASILKGVNRFKRFDPAQTADTSQWSSQTVAVVPFSDIPSVCDAVVN